VIDHGNGHRTRYLHLNAPGLPPQWPSTSSVARGEILGYEGSTGYTDPPGFNHLHFETRHGATTFTCGKDGTAVDPYATSTYMWQDNPPNHADFSPASASWVSSRRDVFVRGGVNADGTANDQLYQRTNESGSWTAPIAGSCLRSGPAASSWSNTRIDVFYRGCDNAIWHNWWTGGSIWYGESLGGCTLGAPGAASWGTNRLDVFIRGCDNALWHYWWVGGPTWYGEGLGGCLRSGPAAVSWGNNRLDVVYRGCDDAIWHSWQQNGSAWHGESLGGCTMLSPGIASWESGKLDVFHRGCGPAGAGEGMYQKSYSGSWGGWTSLGGCLASGPGADAWAPDKIDVFIRGCDSPANSYRDVFNTSWSGWSVFRRWPPPP